MGDELKMKTINFGGADMNLHYLEMILKVINEDGEIIITHLRPGTVSFLELGATLAEKARENVGK